MSLFRLAWTYPDPVVGPLLKADMILMVLRTNFSSKESTSSVIFPSVFIEVFFPQFAKKSSAKTAAIIYV